MYIHTLSVEVTLSNVPLTSLWSMSLRILVATTEAGCYYPLNGEHLSLVAAHLHSTVSLSFPLLLKYLSAFFGLCKSTSKGYTSLPGQLRYFNNCLA